MTVRCAYTRMSSQWWSTDGSRAGTAQPPLTVELEPTRDGGQRALLYPTDSPGHEIATNWLAVPADHLIELDDRR